MTLVPTSAKGAAVSTTTIVQAGDLIVGSGANAVARLARGSNGKALVSDDSASNGLAFSPFPGFVVVTAAADQSIASSTTLTNDAELFFATAAGGVYEIYCVIAYSSPLGGATPDMRVAFGEDATARGTIVVTGRTATDTAISTTVSADQTTIQSLGTAATPRGASAVGPYFGNGGTFRLLWAQNTSGANPTTRLAGSVLGYRRIV